MQTFARILAAIRAWLMTDRRWMWVLPAFVAAALQVAMICETATQPAFAIPLIDAAAYHQQAREILVDNIPREPFWQPPLYPYALALLYSMVGQSLLLVRLVHGMIFAPATALLTFFLARRLLSQGAAMAAALIVALYGPLVFYANQLLPTAAAATLDLAALLCIFRALERPSLARWAGAGVMIGVAGLAVPNALIMAPVAAVAGWRAARRAGGWSRAAAHVGMLALGIIAVLAPVAVRNRIVGGSWTPIATNGGINIFIGNNPRMDVTIATRPGIDWERLEIMPHVQGAVTPAAAECYFWREAGRFIVEHPLDFVLNLARKAWHTMTARELPRNFDLYVMRDYSHVLAPLVWRTKWFAFPFGLLAPFACAGIALYGARRREWTIMALVAILYLGSVALFFPAGRYRAPMIPLLAIFAVAAVTWLARWREQSVRQQVAWGVTLLLTAIAINLPAAFPTNKVDFRAELYNAIGTGLEVRGRRLDALEWYETAIKCDPRMADAHYNRANALANLRRNIEAAAAYREAIRLRPDHDKARVNLGLLFYGQGQIQNAMNEFSMAVAMNPMNPKAHANFAIALYGDGKFEEALEHFRAAAAINPTYLPTYQQVAAEIENRNKGKQPR